MTPREEQIKTLRDSAKALRTTVKRAREEAAEWQGTADRAREKADRDEENARVWELLADALDGGQLDDIVVPLGTGRDDRTTNTRIHALQGRLMAELADCDLDAWNIHCGELKAMLHPLYGGSRETIAIIAERLGISYVEKTRSDGQIYVEAGGEIDNIRVEVWSLLDAEEESSATVEHVDYAEAEAVREIEHEMAIEAGDDSEIDQQVAEDDARAEAKYIAGMTTSPGAWEDPAVRQAVRETIAESEA